MDAEYEEVIPPSQRSVALTLLLPLLAGAAVVVTFDAMLLTSPNCTVLGVGAWVCSALMLIPLLVAPSSCSLSCTRLLVFLSSTTVAAPRRRCATALVLTPARGVAVSAGAAGAGATGAVAYATAAGACSEYDAAAAASACRRPHRRPLRDDLTASLWMGERREGLIERGRGGSERCVALLGVRVSRR